MAGQSFGDVAREVVRAEGAGRLRIGGLALATHFQPIYSVDRGTCEGFEALLRAQSDDGQPLRARALFRSLGRAERTRLDWVCRAMHLRSFAVADPGTGRLFLNADPMALADDHEKGHSFVELVRYYGLSPGRVVIEVLEGDSENEGRLEQAVAAHRALGFTMAMDHFGQGHSNFDRVAALRPKIVKIDRATLTHALGDTQARRMLPALVDLLVDSGALVALKGIDNAGDALAAIEAGARYIQGFLLGAPSREPRDEALAARLVESARHLAAA